MKIVLVIPTITQGGAERVMSELANEWSNIGHDIHLILLANDELFYSLNSNIKVYQLGFHNTGKINKIISELKTFFKLRKLLKNLRPEFVLSFMEKYNAFTILASSFLGLRVYVSDRSNPLRIIPKSINYLRNFTYPNANGIIAQTTLAKDVLFSNTGNLNIKVIPNPVKHITKENKYKREKIILNVGRLVQEKGQKYLLEVFSLLKNKSDWKLIILGEGPLKKDLEYQAEILGIKDQVFMLGAVNNVDEWLMRASIFIFPSISEGYPNALVEAMSAGLPCISFNCDAGPRDIIINNINGILVEVEDVKQLFFQLSKLIEDQSLRDRLGTEALNFAKELNISKIAKEYLDFCTNKI